MAFINHFLLLTIFFIAFPASSMHKEYSQDYLNSEPFKQRLVKAAEWLDNDCELIIEIGGGSGRNSINNYIKAPKIIIIDPALPKSRDYGSVEHVKRGYQFWKIDQDAIINNKKFAVVIMALQLEHMQGNDWQDLFKLVDRSQKTIVEYSISFSDAKKQFEIIKAGVNKKITKEIEFDFSDKFSAQSRVPVYRRMVLFENAEEHDSISSEKKDIPSESLKLDELNETFDLNDLEKFEHY